MTTDGFVEIVQWAVFVYFVTLNCVYFALLISAFLSAKAALPLHAVRTGIQTYQTLQPPISIIAPAYNEEKVVVDSVRAMLQLDYPEFEIIVVCDGPKDRTLEVLMEAFDLEPFSEAYRERIKAKPLKQVYLSRTTPRLKVVLKENGGKADALNVGVNIAQYPLFAALDTDSLIERDALNYLAAPFVNDPGAVVAGGTLRLSNGSAFHNGALVESQVPDNWWARFQVVEYQRAFMVGRVGFDRFNAVLVVSGAFGLFHKETVVAAGGYNHKCIGEDMELVVRLHKYCRLNNKPYRVYQVTEAVCWTEAPEDLKSLKSQRIRWHRGLTEVLMFHKDMLLSPKMGSALLSMHYFLFFEWLAPIVEFLGYLFLVWLACTGYVSWAAYWGVMLLALGPALFMTVSALFLDELTLRGYNTRKKDSAIYLLVAFIEPFTFRVLTLYWRVIAVWRIFKGQKVVWEPLARKGFDGNKKPTN